MSYSVGDKFVLEIKEIDDFENHIVLEKIAVDIGMLDQLERLDSDYINEHYGELQDESYNKGLEDAWELARKIYYYVQDGGFTSQEMMVIFDTDDPCKALKKHTALEAVKRYEEYKKETASERPQRNKKAV